MHNLAFRYFGENSCYTKTLVKDGNSLKDIFLKLSLSGANVTVPHKEIAFKLCDKVDKLAMQIGAINTIVKKDKYLIGYNTDALGFMMSIQPFKKEKVLILGAGGTAKAISTIMKKENINVTILNRSEKRLKSFDGIKKYSWDNFYIDNYDMVINTTSAGLLDNSLPAPDEIIYQIVQNSEICCDVVYGKKTPFLELAKDKKKIYKDGSDMLLYQGVLAFDYFTNHKYDIKDIEKVMKKAFLL